MAKNEQKRQQKLARQKQKRKAKQKTKAQLDHRNSSASLLIEVSDSLPLELCERYSNPYIPDAIDAIFVTRRAPGGRTLLASFLIDSLCLGVKDCFVVLEHSARADQAIGKHRESGQVESLDLDEAMQYIDGAVAFAARWGLSPAPEFSLARKIFGKTEPRRGESRWTFGRNGKPCFYQGPHDSDPFAKDIVASLEATCGSGNYEYFPYSMGLHRFRGLDISRGLELPSYVEGEPDGDNDEEFVAESVGESAGESAGENSGGDSDERPDPSTERAEDPLRMIQRLISENEEELAPIRRALQAELAAHDEEMKRRQGRDKS